LFKFSVIYFILFFYILFYFFFKDNYFSDCYGFTEDELKTYYSILVFLIAKKKVTVITQKMELKKDLKKKKNILDIFIFLINVLLKLFIIHIL